MPNTPTESSDELFTPSFPEWLTENGVTYGEQLENGRWRMTVDVVVLKRAITKLTNSAHREALDSFPEDFVPKPQAEAMVRDAKEPLQKAIMAVLYEQGGSITVTRRSLVAVDYKQPVAYAELADGSVTYSLQPPTGGKPE